jgi:hypothetical protein
MSESETKIAVGACAEISERGEWTTFHIDVGSQYPVKLSTKLQPVIEVARAASKSGGSFVWAYTESEGAENPHKPGTRYKNRYLTSVEPAAEGSTLRDLVGPVGVRPESPAPQTEGMTPEKWDAKERRDYRSRAWAQTLAAFQHTIKVDEPVEDVFLRLQPFQRKVYVDVTGMFAFPADESDLPFS